MWRVYGKNTTINLQETQTHAFPNWMVVREGSTSAFPFHFVFFRRNTCAFPDFWWKHIPKFWKLEEILYRCGKTCLAHMHLQSLFRSLCGNICSCSHAPPGNCVSLEQKKRSCHNKNGFQVKTKAATFAIVCNYLFNIYIYIFIYIKCISFLMLYLPISLYIYMCVSIMYIYI